MMPSLPPMQMSSSATATGGSAGGGSAGISSGDWSVNFAGNQMTGTTWVIIALAALAAVVLLKKRG
ncbi:hypothetical protein [Pseudoduganella namucuonensis]|uniref:Uncharacterized protein n=1 Tax=Pseudoduganella namucuonensis TaxID=1035707 RepID=A0A1I7KQE0_9BURK|nr:hypothetical protein [Pseudoduganella namucuonensis]SFU99629.1 hypothetical protein SAMN05216552_1018134 [Pseudoduganella namucuonensis]